ncbi:MAG: NUDIX domain-containing protein [Ignavibacteriales bacterium]|nr:NUDIX domain-containing protein [Ignavibacteriales bacterium]
MTRVAVGIIRNNGKFLLCQRKKGSRYGLKWEFPGGAVEFGDTLENTIIREMMEEFDIEIEIIDTLGVCKIINGEPRILEPHKSSKIGWFTLSELAGMKTSAVTAERIGAIKKKYPDDLPDFY